MPVGRPFVFPIATGRNVGASARQFDGLDQFVPVIAFVGSNRGGLDASNQGRALGDIGDLSSGQNQAQGVTQGIDANKLLKERMASLRIKCSERDLI